ncbi:MAG: tRNA preQ1(34) S-adenosylmethionine ribosyltransferase-isomerase QueA [Bacteroidetes bacterium]|nr:tRNA preQ1(34) S-adenosylmethionine ribosyltransferase-isomerase QueA [Bacteroidota bacterium]MDA0904312.1 tRNA preQ1(34) S-adenosylmethionine ribosyltransferase-isomerase QueA [Bacteroidota bacterium]MDA1242825.1 tRNA preQ1(34) S-adenosylmethionine ribosyltransferase-isomerase QueA [Bacteroidota bacterium]
MKLSQFRYDVPKDLVAQYPLDNRDDSRLLVVHRDTGKFEHRMFKDVVDMFDEGDVFVANNTKVFPAKMYGNKEKTGAVIEVFLLRELNRESLLWDVLVDPARKIRIGNKLYFGENDQLVAEVIDNTTSRGRTLRFLFNGSHEEFMQTINELGETPLPRYMTRPAEPEDRDRFQTIYATEEGAVAVPTAGLHFSKNLLKRLEIKGIDMAFLTLHIGLGTFREVEVEDLSKHKVDSEQLIINEQCVSQVNHGIEQGKKVVAVGTTALRGLENSVSTTNTLKPFSGWTNRFIYPNYDFQIANALITNFHTPQSTLLMVTSAFAGHELTMEAYHEAIKEKYRFFAYGDALLIL